MVENLLRSEEECQRLRSDKAQVHCQGKRAHLTHFQQFYLEAKAINWQPEPYVNRVLWEDPSLQLTDQDQP